MRILTIVGAYLPAYVHGGTVYTTHKLSQALMARGHEVLVLTTDICGKERLEVPRGATQWEGVPVKYCRWIRCPIPYYSPELAREVRRLAKSFDIALISSSWTGYGVLSGIEARRAGLSYIMYAHGSYAPARLRRSGLRKKLWWMIFDKQLYNSASVVVALTKAEIAEIRSMGVKTPIVHIPNGIDLDDLQPVIIREELEKKFPTLSDRRLILFLGRIDPIKGIDVLIHAFADIVFQFPNAMLVLAGPGERGYDKEIKRLVHECCLEKDVCFTGLVTTETKNGLLYSAEAFVLPSYGEGMAIAALEALACGIPVVLSPGCNLPEVAEVGAGLIADVESESFASALRAILSDPALSRRMSAKGQQLAREHFNWQMVAERTESLCLQVLNRGLSSTQSNQI